MNVTKRILFGLSMMVMAAGSAPAFAIGEDCGGQFDMCTVPEPGSLPLMVAGLVAAVAVARFFGKKK